MYKRETKFNPDKVKNDIINWIREYFSDAPDTMAVIGISGGKDSSVSAALCTEAIGRERVLAVLMPQNEQFDIDVSYKLCEHLGLEFVEINIGNTVSSLYKSIPLRLNNVARFNTPARIRMATLYAVAASVHGRVVNNCNLSETFVGWGTKFGDMAGDLSPLSSLTVTEVKAIGRMLGLSSLFVDKPPIDGLCGKTDEEGLGFSYDVLDRYIRTGVCENDIVRERIETLNKASRHKKIEIPSFKNPTT